MQAEPTRRRIRKRVAELDTMSPRAHVIMVPLPVQGHINPFLWLAEYLVAEGIDVTFVHAAHLNKNASENGTPPSHHPNIRVEVVPDLLEGQSSREAVYASLPVMQKGLEDVLQRVLDTTDDDASAFSVCIISDNHFPNAHQVAFKYDIPIIELVTNSVASYCLFMFASQLQEHGFCLPMEPGSSEGERPVDFIVGMPPSMQLADIPLLLLSDKPDSKFFKWICESFENANKADRVLLNSFYALEVDVIEALRKYKPNMHMDPIGPLIKRPTRGMSLHQEDDGCIQWLDMQPKESVVYVSFGSMATFGAHAMEELALGLEASQQRFLWVIRSDMLIDTSLDTFLPSSLKKSLSIGHGLIISWAPQLNVLAHPSIGAFITHCGWNSTIESLCFGVPMIGIPQGAEQNTNLKFIMDVWKVGIPLSNHLHKLTFDRVAIEASIKSIMCEQEGHKVRHRACELKEAAKEAMFQNGSSQMALQKLVMDIKTLNLKKPSFLS